MFKCIYCKSVGGSDLFNREHVIPKALGTFEPENFVLENTVCIECNTKYFSGNLELLFLRGSLEALARFKHGLKPLVEITEIRRDRIMLELCEEGEFKGAKLCFAPHWNGNEPIIDLVPQVGFMPMGKKTREFFELLELKRLKTFDKEKYNLSDEYGIVYCAQGDESEQEIEAELARLNIKFQKRGYLADPHSPGGKLMVEVTGKIDDIARRTIAKIAFNYLTLVQGVDYALRTDFDPVRRYIRYGERPANHVVTPSNNPILAMDTSRKRHTKGHIVVLEAQNGLRTLVSKVSLFNDVTYVVTLCRNLSGVLRRINSGHHFDIRRRKIDPVIGVRLTPPIWPPNIRRR